MCIYIYYDIPVVYKHIYTPNIHTHTYHSIYCEYVVYQDISTYYSQESILTYELECMCTTVETCLYDVRTNVCVPNE